MCGLSYLYRLLIHMFYAVDRQNAVSQRTDSTAFPMSVAYGIVWVLYCAEQGVTRDVTSARVTVGLFAGLGWVTGGWEDELQGRIHRGAPEHVDPSRYGLHASPQTYRRQVVVLLPRTPAARYVRRTIGSHSGCQEAQLHFRRRLHTFTWEC